MTLLTRRKLSYLASIVLLAAVVLWLLSALEGPTRLAVMLVAAAALLIPGRLNGHLWRELYRGRRLLGEEDFTGAEAASTRFIEAIRQRPQLRAARWAVGMVHTREPEAMALNNRAVARLGLGQPESALADLRAAASLDPTYALALANQAGLLAALGDADASAACRARAIALGLREDQIEQLISQAAGLLARVEG